MPEEVSGFTTYVPGDRSLMSRDIGLTRFGWERDLCGGRRGGGARRATPQRRSPGAVRCGGARAGMSRARVAVLKAATGQLSVTAAAAECGFPRRPLHRLLVRYRV